MTTTPALHPQRPGREVLTAVPGVPTGPALATPGSAGQHPACLGLPSAQQSAAQRPGSPAVSTVMSSTSPSPSPVRAAISGDPQSSGPCCEVQKPSLLSSKGPKLHM